MRTEIRRAGACGGLAIALSLFAGGLASAEPPRFRVPLDCEPGVTCWVSTYFDHDPGSGHKDHACGPITYDTHGGIDFAISNLAVMERGVTVIASAPGVVVGTRNHMQDISIRDIEPGSLGGQDCGNGVRIDHGDGWHSQYCHLKKDSVLVRTGQQVEIGTPLGLVGLSGRTEHPHVHLSITKDGQKLDPYTGTAEEAGCGTVEQPLWHASVLEDFPYRTGLIRDLVFSLRVPDRKEVQAGTAGVESGSTDAEVVVLSIETMGNLRDHTIEMTIHDPRGRQVSANTYDQPKVYTYARIGRKRPGPGWPAGTYTGEATIRDGKGQVTDRRSITLELN